MSEKSTRNPLVNDQAMNVRLDDPARPHAPAVSLSHRSEEERRLSNEVPAEELASYVSILSSTLESTADGIVVLDLAGNITSYNTKFAQIWQFPLELLQRRNGDEMRHYSAQQLHDPQEFPSLVRKHLAAPEVETFDVIELKDGRTLERYGFPQRVNGECVGVVISFRDVTRRAQTEAALRISEEKYRLLWATAGDAFVLFNSDNLILEANAAVTTIFGYEPKEVIGQELGLLQPEHLREGHRRGIKRYLETGSRSLNWSAAEAVGLHRDGRHIPIEIAFNHVHLEGKDLFAGFIRDITQRKEAEQASARLAAIVDSSHDAIASKTLEGIVTSWNKAAENLFGYSAAEMIGQPILKLIPPERSDEEPHFLAQLSRGEGINHFETVRQRKDGQLIHVSITLSPIRDSAGRIIGISKIARDITARKHAEAEREALLAREKKARQEAQSANRIKDEFLATLSHELRTPLNAIIGWSHLLGDSRLSEEEKEQGLGIIKRSAFLQARLVEDILDVSRIITGKMRLETSSVELSEVVTNAVDSVLPTAQAKGVRLQQVLDSGPLLVSGDAARLQQVLWNLLANAIKFTDTGGQVEIGLQRAGSHAEIRVSDTGIGIHAEMLPHVFERFRQADQSSTRNHGGLGLGLAIVRHLVEAHGGTIQASSAGEGQGAIFTVQLPLLLAG